MRKLLWYERFVMGVWVARYSDSADTLRDLAFEHELRQLYTLYYNQHDMKQAWTVLAVMKRRFIADDPPPVSHRQEARFYYLAGQIAFGNRKWEDALQYLTLASDQVEKQHWANKVEVTRWAAMIQFMTQHHLVASDKSQEVLTSLKHTLPSTTLRQKYRLTSGKHAHHRRFKRRLHFLHGEYDDFVHTIRFLHAQTLHGRGHFEESLKELDDCLAYVQRWFLHHLRIARRHTLSSFTQRYRHNPSGIPVFSLEKLLHSPHARNQDQMLKKMIESYCKILWQHAMTLYWREKLKPHFDILYSFEELRSAFRLLDDLIAACRNVPMVMPMIPTMYRARTEIALLLSTFQRSKLPLAYHWLNAFHWLRIVSQSLLLADTMDILAKGIDQFIYQESPETAQLLYAQFEKRRYEIAKDDYKYSLLILKVESLYDAAKNQQKRHLGGLCCLLLGKLHAETEQYDIADKYFVKALSIFEEEGDYLEQLLER